MELGSTLRRMVGLLAVAVAAIAAGVCVHAQPALADKVLDAKRAKYARVRSDIRRLDNRAEFLTEQYDHVVWQLGVLRKRMRIATHRLIVERAKLRYEQGILSELIVQQYKGGDPATIDLVLSASSLSQVAGGMDLKARLDAAVSETVKAINAARLAIAAERRTIAAAQIKARRDKREITIRRHQITKALRRRHRLVALLGRQITVMTAADRIGQAELALEAQKWLTADLRADVADPGQEMRDHVALDALQQIGVPYVWGGATPKRLRLLGPRDVAVREVRRGAAPLRRLPVPPRPADHEGRPASGRPGLLPRPRPRRDVHRQRLGRARTAHGRLRPHGAASRWGGSRPPSSAPPSPAPPDPANAATYNPGVDLAPQLTPAQAGAALEEGALAVDVREPEEWEAGHVDGSLWIPLGELAGPRRRAPPRPPTRDRVPVGGAQRLRRRRAGRRGLRRQQPGRRPARVGRGGLPLAPAGGYVL